MLRQILQTLALASAALAVPMAERRQDKGSCVNPLTRKAWHTLSNDEKKAYIDAELCLMEAPATLGLRGAKTKFDELQTVHVFQTEIAHGVGQFFPFHRLYVRAHEQSLQEHCGYKGAQPYWAEDLDAGAFSKSEIFDPETGFGGDGVGESRCIQDGPFASYQNALGPGYKISDHCIQRQISDRMSLNASQEHVQPCMEKTTFEEFWLCAEMGPHGAGHGGVGAQMGNPISSPGDPLFFLHHTWLDRIWAKWQAEDPDTRLTEMGGNNRQLDLGGFPGFGPPPGGADGPGFPGFPGGPDGAGPPGDFPPLIGDPEDLIRPDDVPEPQVIGDPANVTTLAHVIEMYGIIPDATVGDVMDIRGELLCYDYD